MRRRRISNGLFFALALCLHLLLLSSAYVGNKKSTSIQPLPPLAVSLPRPAEPAAAPAPSIVPAAIPDEPVKRISKPKPKSKQATPVRPQPKIEETQPEPSHPPQNLPETPAVSAPPAPPAPTAQAPAKSGVTIPASYAATNRKPDYPSLSRRYGEQGTVVLRIFVKADGTAGEVQLKSSSGFPLLDKSAIAAVRDWRFNPATSDGKAYAEWYQISIPFKLEN
jgi:periplasmic protein TonB